MAYFFSFFIFIIYCCLYFIAYMYINVFLSDGADGRSDESDEESDSEIEGAELNINIAANHSSLDVIFYFANNVEW